MARAILFDCDGVLVDSEVLALEVELASLAEIDLHFEAEAYSRRFLGTSTTDFFAALDAVHRDAFGAPLPEDFEPRLKARYRAAFEARLAPIPGVHETLRTLDLPRAVASSSSVAGLTRKLEQTGIAAFFGPHVYSAEMVARGKPAPDLFLHAAHGLGADPTSCIVVEDSVHGVRAAVAAGMPAIGFVGGGHCSAGHGEVLRAAGATVVVRHMTELAAALAGLGAGATSGRHP